MTSFTVVTDEQQPGLARIDGPGFTVQLDHETALQLAVAVTQAVAATSP
jgi:hypothetical protein